MPRGRAPMRRSEPKASAMKPRSSSAAVNVVSWGGASANAPDGGGSRFDAASEAVAAARKTARPARSRFIDPRSRLTPQAHQAFLDHRRDQGAVAGEYKSARQPARAMQVRRVLRVEQPLVGAERAVQPQRMVAARRHELVLEQGAAVPRQRRVEQRQDGGAGAR